MSCLYPIIEEGRIVFPCLKLRSAMMMSYERLCVIMIECVWVLSERPESLVTWEGEIVIEGKTL